VIGRQDLPLRDILRFALPGLIAAGYSEVVAYEYVGHFLWERALTQVFLMVALLFGLLSFAAAVHKRLPPWKKRWNDFIGNIRKEMDVILKAGGNLDETTAKPVYKMWLEASDERKAVRGYLQYSTGVFYSYAALAAWSAMLAVVTAPLLIASSLALLGICTFGFSSPAGLRFSVTPAAAILVLAFGKQALDSLHDLNADTLVALRPESVRDELRQIHSGAENARGSNG
jgi:hypothetical protein